jgi:hypothetical protein
LYGQDIQEVKATKVIKSKQRLICLTVNEINLIEEKKKSKLLKKRKNKVTKDEKKILKR